MPQVKWIETNELYWEDRYVNGCCWQLLLPPWWLVPIDRSVEIGVFDTATTINQVITLFSVFIYCFLNCCWCRSQIKAFWAFYFYKLAYVRCSPLHFVGSWLLTWKYNLIFHWHIQITHSDMHNDTNFSSFSPFSSLLFPSHVYINIQAGVGGGAFAAWWG